MAADRTLGPNGPPLAYRIDEVTLRLTRHPGNSAFPIRRISISGTGSASLEHDGRLVQFPYATKDLMILLNELYKIRFFDLPVKYTTRYSIFLKEDGIVGTSALRMADAGSTSVCFAVAEYEKCVTYGRDGPLELENIAKRIFADTEGEGLAGER
ncbi:hypothetical protein [Nitrosovibrio sp. Nv4]|uniref:hypothetical protein n=1 Tax=Nitrosovibrio sp. Nv4 TaxID=1945880 RepID=UPI000BD789EF|nr:hypothetical protein [Nitrosovibrio sp. Nv4]SOD42589.1 hypothetical protein SAMN06298226_2940 [Nitrosovibrio sp. Nv4]